MSLPLPAISVPARRLPLVAGAILVLLLAMWAGLLRLGFNWAAFPAAAVAYHGPLMVGGFLGTLISLERSVALRRLWTYGAPALSLMAAIALLAGLNPAVGQWLMLASSAVLVAVFIKIVLQQTETFTITMGLGAVAWLVGNAVWLHTSVIPYAVPWWIAFLILTIVGERLELSRLLPRTRLKQPTFIAATSVYALGLVVGLWLPGLGWSIAGLGLLLMAIWLFVYDIARRTVRQSGLTRFAAACLLSGYFFLALGGLLALYHTAVAPHLLGYGDEWMSVAPMAGLAYDSILHALLLGFVFAMIFGHAPIIFPAVLAIHMDYRPRFYSHLVLLQASVLSRIVLDVIGSPLGRQWSGLLNATALLLFLGNTVTSVRFHAKPAAPLPRRTSGKSLSLAVTPLPSEPA